MARDAVEFRRRRVADDGAWAGAEHRGEELRLVGERGWAERVDASVPPVEGASLDALANPPAREPRRQELSVRDQVLLAGGKRLDGGGVSTRGTVSTGSGHTPMIRRLPERDNTEMPQNCNKSEARVHGFRIGATRRSSRPSTGQT
jgi:hypothetical protein